jgi:hypothetical protein
MLARAMGWNEPEKVDIASAMDVRICIGGTGDPIAGGGFFEQYAQARGK